MIPPPLPNAELRRLKATAQRLDPMLKVGRQGLSQAFVASVDHALQHHELVKIRFDEFKEERAALSRRLAEETASHLIMQVGHVIVLHRPQAADARKAEGASEA